MGASLCDATANGWPVAALVLNFDGGSMRRKIGQDAVDYEPAELLIDTGGDDRPAMLVALLALAYGLPLTTILAARRGEFDLTAEVWRLPGGGRLPLTPPIMRLMRLHQLRLHLFTSGREPDSLMFTGQDGGQLSEDEVERRVQRLTRGSFTLSELRALVLSRYPYFETAPERIEARVIELTARREKPERIASFRHNTSTNLRRRLDEWHKAIRLGELLGVHNGDKRSNSGQ